MWFTKCIYVKNSRNDHQKREVKAFEYADYVRNALEANTIETVNLFIVLAKVIIMFYYISIVLPKQVVLGPLLIAAMAIPSVSRKREQAT